MIPIISILSSYLIYFLIEVYHDDILRLVRNKGRHLMVKLESVTWDDRKGYKAAADVKQDDDWNKAWHRLDWFGHALLASLITFLLVWFTKEWFNLILIAYIITCRNSILGIGGNLLAKRKWHYLGNGKWDKIFKGSEKIYFIVNNILFVGSSYLLIWGVN